MKNLLILFCVVMTLPLFSQDTYHLDMVWEEELFPDNPYMVEFDQMDRPYFYVANDQGGILIYEFLVGSSDPEKILQIPTSEWEEMKVMKLSQSGNYLYLALGSFFDGDNTDYGMAIIDVSDPGNSFLTSYWKSPTPKKGSAIVETKGNYAYLGAMNDGVQILDISDPQNITHVTQIKPDPNFPVANPGPSQEPNARGMAVEYL